MATKLVNMKMDREEGRTLATSAPDAPDQPAYPYGLRLELDDDVLDKLGLGTLPKVGTTKMLMAQVDVVSVSESESAEGGPDKRLGLQITDLSLEDVTASKSLYTEGG